MSQTIVDKIERFARNTPNKICATFFVAGKKDELTYKDLYQQSLAIAKSIDTLGVHEDDLVIVAHEQSRYLFSAFIGTMLAGAVPAMMPPPSPKQHADLFWRSHDQLYAMLLPRLFITSSKVGEAYRKNLAVEGHQIATIDKLFEIDGRHDYVPPTRKTNQTAFVQHSSGTTSLKKGVALDHHTVIQHINIYSDCINLNETSKIASWLPLYHDMGLVTSFLLPLCMGVPVAVLDPLEWSARPATLLKVIEGEGCTHVWMPNFAFEHLCNSVKDPSSFDLSSLQALINCSEPCRAQTFHRFASHFADAKLDPVALQVCYAMAENVFAVTQTEMAKLPLTHGLHGAQSGGAQSTSEFRALSCGAPLERTQLRILDEAGKIVTDGSIGEISILTPTLFSDYYKRPGLRSSAFDNDWFLTGDIGFVYDSELYVVGRKDDMILSYGRNFLAYELEGILNLLAEIIPGRVVVFAVDGSTSGTQELAVACEAATDIGERELQRIVRATLDAAASITPKHVWIVPRGALVKSTSGKISRKANRDAFLRHQTETA